MTTVSFQGVQLTASEKNKLAQMKQVRQFLNPVLQASIEETIKSLDKRKEEGAKPERQWFPHFESTGTISIAEHMGF